VRFKFLALALANAIFISSHLAEAQQPPGKLPRIGFVAGTAGPSVGAFQRGLRELGYVEGKNILIEYRYTEGKEDRIASLVDELLQLKVDILVSLQVPVILAAKQVTKTIPIVMVITGDPVAAGLVDSLARPGGNVTGVTRLMRELSGKRLELLKEAVPTIARVGVLSDTNNVTSINLFKEYEAAARALKIPLQSLEVRGPNPDLEGAFQAAAKRRISALITVRNPVLIRNSKRIAELAIKNRLPLMCEGSDFVEAGGLMSYAGNDAENFRRAAVYVDKILKGAKPADLPVEQPTKFEFVINLKTAKALNLTIPQSVLFRADRVIK
jgi:putative tryptophan/tyrosine transport system substrate-binding protein